MVEYLKTLPSGTLIAIILAMAFVFKYVGEVVAFFFKDFWQKGKDKDSALQANTQAIIKLEVRIELLTELLAIVPKLKADVDRAHDKIRDIEQRN